MSSAPGFVRRQARVLVAALLLVPLYLAAREPAPSAAERAELVARFAFAHQTIAVPEIGPLRTTRAVHPEAAPFAGWINVLGAGLALADVDGDGLPNDAVLSDPRRNRVFVVPVPGSGARYAPFALDPAPLAWDDETMAPMGARCADFDGDGELDVLVYAWGRSPIIYLRRPDAALSAQAFAPRELVEPFEDWYTNAAVVADVDGDGTLDIVLGNYFQDGARVLDAHATTPHVMQDSMSRARNGGRNRIFLATAPQSGAALFREAPHSILGEVEACAWTLAIGAADLDGDALPELYFANDFGPDQLYHNRSRPGAPLLAPLHGEKTLAMPNSKVLGRDSFKGMGVDFGDLNGDGWLDLYVSNITTEFGLEESQFAFVSTGAVGRMRDGIAPYVERSEELGLARSGWAWDARLVDLDNDGGCEALQALGFLRGRVNRWPELHEVAMGADFLLAAPQAWHRFGPGDDLSGQQHTPLFARIDERGRFADVAADVGLGEVQIARAIAVADVDGDGDLDLAFGNQWQDSYLYENRAPRPGAWLGLRLVLPPIGTQLAATKVLDGRPAHLRASPALGASARLRRADGRLLVAQIDGGSGHSGARSPEILFGLGAASAQQLLSVELTWRDRSGAVRHETQALLPGWHTLELASPGGAR